MKALNIRALLCLSCLIALCLSPLARAEEDCGALFTRLFFGSKEEKGKETSKEGAKEAAQETAQKIGQKGSTEAVVAENAVNLRRTARLRRFAKDRAATLGMLALAGVSGSITASYEDEGKDFYNDHVKKPFRRFVISNLVKYEVGGKEAIESTLQSLSDQNEEFAHHDIAALSRADANRFLTTYEDKIRAAVKRYQKYTDLTGTDDVVKRAYLKASAEQLLELEKTFADANLRIKSLAGEAAKEDRDALQSVIQQSANEISESVAGWTLYKALTPKARAAGGEEDESDVSETEKRRFEEARKFIATSVPPGYYQKALAGKMDEALEKIRELFEGAPKKKDAAHSEAPSETHGEETP